MYSALNGIFFISKKNNKYGINEEVYEQMINELEAKFAPSFDEAQVDYFQTEHLRKVYKVLYCDFSTWTLFLIHLIDGHERHQVGQKDGVRYGVRSDS
jgi:hypothetical protein